MFLTTIAGKIYDAHCECLNPSYFLKWQRIISFNVNRIFKGGCTFKYPKQLKQEKWEIFAPIRNIFSLALYGDNFLTNSFTLFGWTSYQDIFLGLVALSFEKEYLLNFMTEICSQREDCFLHQYRYIKCNTNCN